MRFSGVVVVILCLTVQINLPLNYRLIFSLSVGKHTKSAGDQKKIPHCIIFLILILTANNRYFTIMVTIFSVVVFHVTTQVSS